MYLQHRLLFLLAKKNDHICKSIVGDELLDASFVNAFPFFSKLLLMHQDLPKVIHTWRFPEVLKDGFCLEPRQVVTMQCIFGGVWENYPLEPPCPVLIMCT
jgi:hypothetical protein